MSTTHTPGPWALAEVEDGGIHHLCPTDSDGLSLLTVVHEGDTPFGAVFRDEDALLIAAAPELLAALQAILIQIKRPGPYVFRDSEDLKAALAAVAKATGATA